MRYPPIRSDYRAYLGSKRKKSQHFYEKRPIGLQMLNFWQTMKDRVQGKAPKGARRSSKWRKVRAAHIKKYPCCAVCGLTSKVECHHVIPFSLAPDLELDPNNLVTLCENGKYGVVCHRHYGHLGNYRRANPNAKIDILTWRIKLNVFDKNRAKKGYGKEKD